MAETQLRLYKPTDTKNLALSMNPIEKNNRIMDLSRIWRSEWVVWQKIYQEIEKGYLWLAGEQYTKEQQTWYDSQRRPHNVFNLIFPHVNTVLGEFLESDKTDRVFPVGQSDPKIAEVLQDILTGIRNDNDDEDALSQVLLAGLVKMGWIYTRYSNQRDTEGSVISSYVDEFEILFDSRAKSYYADDAAYLQRHRWMTTDQILDHPRWRSQRSEIDRMILERRESRYWEGLDEDTQMMMTNVDLADEFNGKYRVIEHHEKKWELTEVAYNPETRHSMIFDLEGEKADEWIRNNPEYKIIERYDEVKYIDTLIPGINYLVDSRKADLQDRKWDYTPLFAYHYGMRTIDNFGIFKNSFGPQMEFNEWHNRTADMINKTANPGTISKPSHIENARQLDSYGSMPGLNIKLKPSATGDPESYFKTRTVSQFHPGMVDMQERSLDLLPKILGITPNQMGFSETRQEPAELFARRVQQASKALAVMYKNISKTKKRKGDKELACIQRHYTTARVVQVFIKSSASMQEVAINIPYGEKVINDITIGRYQVYVNDENRNPAMRDVRFQMKLKIAFEYIAALWGPTAIDPQWLFEDANLGDMQQQIDLIVQAIQNAGISGQEQEAMAAANAFIDMAKKQAVTGDKPPANNKQTAETPAMARQS